MKAPTPAAPGAGNRNMRRLRRDELDPLGAGLLPMTVVAIIAALGLASFGFALGLTLGRCALPRIDVPT